MRIRIGGRGQGSLLKVPGSENWRICYYARGKEVRESSDSPDEKVARRFLKQRLAAVNADRAGIKEFVAPTRATVGKLLDRYAADVALRELKSAYKLGSFIRAVRARFGAMRACDVTAEAVNRYVADLRAAGKRNATINRQTQVLGAAFKLGKLAVPEFVKLSEAGNAAQGFFEREEFERLLAELPEYLKDAARFAYVTGWRKGEIVTLLWSMVNLVAGTITIPTSKNGEARTIPIVASIAEILRRAEAARLLERDRQPVISDFVFHRGGRCLGDFKRSWKTARIAAGLPHGKVHDLRRTAVRNFEQAGVPRSVAMKITGHKTEAVYRRYAIVSSGDMQRALEKVSMSSS